MRRINSSRKMCGFALLMMLCTTWGCNENSNTKPTLKSTTNSSAASWSMESNANNRPAAQENTKSDVPPQTVEANDYNSYPSNEAGAVKANTFKPIQLVFTEPTDAQMQACALRLNKVVSEIEAFMQGQNSLRENTSI